MEQCVALVDYDALAPDEISFRKGDIINVTGKGSASGFWQGYVVTQHDRPAPELQARGGGKAGGPTTSSSAGRANSVEKRKTGLFANCFVSSNLRHMMSSSFLNKAVCLYAYDGNNDSGRDTPNPGADGAGRSDRGGGGSGEREEGELSFTRGDVLTVVRPSSYPGWWFGVNESARLRMRQQFLQGNGAAAVNANANAANTQRFPLTPANSHSHDGSGGGSRAVGGKSTESGLTAAQEEQTDRVCGSSEKPLLFPINFVSCDIVQAVFPFQSREWFELSCSVGDVILIHRRWNDGWWEGSLRGRIGIFPSNYTAPNICTTQPGFFCPVCKTIYDDTKTANMALFLNRNERSQTNKDGGTAIGAGSDEEDERASSATNLWRECRTCAQHTRVTDSMLQALAAYDAGELDKPDLFAFVRTDVDADRAKWSESEDDAGAHALNRGPRAPRWRKGVAREEDEPSLFSAKDAADLSATHATYVKKNS